MPRYKKKQLLWQVKNYINLVFKKSTRNNFQQEKSFHSFPVRVEPLTNPCYRKAGLVTMGNHLIPCSGLPWPAAVCCDVCFSDIYPPSLYHLPTLLLQKELLHWFLVVVFTLLIYLIENVSIVGRICLIFRIFGQIPKSFSLK